MWLIHDGSNSTLQSETGNLRVRTVGQFQLTKSSTENMLIAIPDGSVELYHNNVKTFATIGNGVSVIGPEGGNAEIEIFQTKVMIMQTNIDWLLMEVFSIFKIMLLVGGKAT